MHADFKRGIAEAGQHFDELRARWPRAFPANPHEVRPLALSVTPMVAAALDWPETYARGVLTKWKASGAYARACLAYPTRISLDGAPSGEAVDSVTRSLARQRLQRLARRAAARLRQAQPRKPPAETSSKREPRSAPAPRAASQPLAPERKRDGLTALKEAGRNRLAAGGR
jgi:sRNA-binding protein